jgi:hypothetical protein
MNKKRLSLEERLGSLPEKWTDLDDACRLFKTTSKSYLKMFLIAHPSVQWRRVINKKSPIPYSEHGAWKWQFRRIGGES